MCKESMKVTCKPIIFQKTGPTLFTNMFYGTSLLQVFVHLYQFQIISNMTLLKCHLSFKRIVENISCDETGNFWCNIIQHSNDNDSTVYDILQEEPSQNMKLVWISGSQLVKSKSFEWKCLRNMNHLWIALTVGLCCIVKYCFLLIILIFTPRCWCFLYDTHYVQNEWQQPTNHLSVREAIWGESPSHAREIDSFFDEPVVNGQGQWKNVRNNWAIIITIIFDVHCSIHYLNNMAKIEHH